MSTEAEMIDRCHVRYGRVYRNGSYVGRRYSRAVKVGSSAGFADRGSRIIDYIATDIFSPPWNEVLPEERVSIKGYGHASIIGHEIKVSRSDYLAELRDPTKADAWARYCNYWYIVAPLGVVRDDLPEGWGLLVPHGPSLRKVVHATRRVAQPMPSSMVASLARAIIRTEVPHD